MPVLIFFFFQAEDGIRDGHVTGVQTCALPIWGTSYGAPTEGEVELAERITTAGPSMEMVRLVSSGTEAAMSAIRLARGATGRDVVVKFEGCYHGHSDGLLASAGSGLATFSLPGSDGVTAGAVADTVILPFNGLEEAEGAFQGIGGRADVMERLAPVGPVYQAGTLSGNPVAVAAGLATLDLIEREDPYDLMEKTAEQLTDALVAALREASVPHVVNRAGSLFSLF